MKTVKAARRPRAGLFDKHLGQKIRELRHQRGISQTELGGAVGISFQQIQKYESGGNRVSAGHLWLISRFFDVPIASMFDGANERMFRLGPNSKRAPKAKQ